MTGSNFKYLDRKDTILQKYEEDATRLSDMMRELLDRQRDGEEIDMNEYYALEGNLKFTKYKMYCHYHDSVKGDIALVREYCRKWLID